MSASNPTQTEAPFSSLAEMQQSHAVMVKGVGNDILAPDHSVRIVEFVHRGVATGKILDAKEDRAAAQGLINFWTARLASAVSKARRADDEVAAYGPQSGPPPEFEDTLLAEFDPETIRSAAGAAEHWIRTLSEDDDDRRVARRVMLRLVRLGSNRRTFESVPTTRAALHEVDPICDKVDAVITRLAADGVIRVTKGNTAETDQVTLRDESLLTTWGSYGEWLQERLSLREKVESWDQGGRHKDALLKDAALDEARTYNDLNPMERQFIEASRRQEIWNSERNRRQKYLFGCFAAVLLAGLLGTGIFAWKSNSNWKRAEFFTRESNSNWKRAEQLTVQLRHAARPELLPARRGGLRDASFYAWFRDPLPGDRLSEDHSDSTLELAISTAHAAEPGRPWGSGQGRGLRRQW